MKWTPAAIKRLRKRLGLTQVVFGRRVGVTLLSVNRWENGHVVPGDAAQSALEKLAKKSAKKAR